MSTTEGEADVEVTYELEDGEINDSDVEDGSYIPLQRPDHFNPTSLMSMQIQDDQSDESYQESSASDSDSMASYNRPKKPKMKLKKVANDSTSQNKKNKYNIWCKTLQEEVLTEELGGCDFAKTRPYGVESYDHTIKYRLENDKFRNKRTVTDRKNVKLRLGPRLSSDSDHRKQSEVRILAELTVTDSDSVDNIAKDIAEKLSEEKVSLIFNIVETVGTSKAIKLYEETKRIEEEGGIMVMNGLRRRTPGGVYIFILKKDPEITEDMLKKIFQTDKQETTRHKRNSFARNRQQKVEQLKQSLTDSDLPTLLTRAETVMAGSGESVAQASGCADVVSNPPPSPVTDTDTQRSPLRVAAADPPTRDNNSSYDEDFLDMNCHSDEMDLF